MASRTPKSRIGAYSWILVLSLFKLILPTICTEFSVRYVFILHVVFSKRGKQSALGLCSLFTLKKAFGQLQQITKISQLKTSSSYIISSNRLLIKRKRTLPEKQLFFEKKFTPYLFDTACVSIIYKITFSFIYSSTHEPDNVRSKAFYFNMKLQFQNWVLHPKLKLKARFWKGVSK